MLSPYLLSNTSEKHSKRGSFFTGVAVSAALLNESLEFFQTFLKIIAI